MWRHEPRCCRWRWSFSAVLLALWPPEVISSVGLCSIFDSSFTHKMYMKVQQSRDMLIVGRSIWHSNRKKAAVGPGCTSTADQIQERWCRFVVWKLVGSHQNSKCKFSLFSFNPICLDLVDQLHDALGTDQWDWTLADCRTTPWKMITAGYVHWVWPHESNNAHFLWSPASFHCHSVCSINPHWGNATKWLNAQ